MSTFDDLPSIIGRLARLESRLERMELARRLESSSIGDGGLVVKDGGVVASDTFDGDLDADDPGTVGWALGGGKGAFASLLLRDRVIGPDQLQIGWDHGTDSAFSFDVTTTETTVMEFDFTVPDWADGGEALIAAWGQARMENQAGSTRFAGMRMQIGPSTGSWLYDEVADGEQAVVSPHMVSSRPILTGGSTITIGGNVESFTVDYGTGVGVGNISAIVLYKT